MTLANSFQKKEHCIDIKIASSGKVSLSASTFSHVLDEAYFQSYTVRVSKMTGWKLALELADRVVAFDRSNEEIERATFKGYSQEIKVAEKMRDREARMIEILHDKAR